ncbi:GGDEF domain-containing protein [Thalassotalea insulae]|uniref:diguanylate cyclase n=1 Tax=Thalassotalea insulae TaxID=2056778 RepID=A0ABQ6GQ49_9GAMM|nr:GGDEF domain-containing protein [Thalassotalea insulae]GLX77304.1 GGDEF domain-containing protein [Thalassotalea insulae]
MLQKLEGLKTTLWTGLAVSLTFAFAFYLQNKWQVKLALIEQVLYGILAVGILFSAQFSRTRITLLLIALSLFYLVKQGVIAGNSWLNANQQWLFVAVIFALAYLILIKDRGLLSIHGVMRLIGLTLCLGLAKGWLYAVDWLVQYNQQQPFIAFDIGAMVVLLPLYAVALFILYQSLRKPALFASSVLTSLVITNLFYQQQLTMPLSVLLSLIAIQYILVVVIDSYYLAYRDELTSLPSRRALNQYALSLGRKYCVAMIDIDHFKKFNDTYGHDIGDQVLKLVASKLATIRAGGRVFRYGGEEFTAIFPRKTAQDVIAELERLRQDIADYKIVIRQPLRKTKKARQGKTSNELKTVSVTISIGVSTRSVKESFEQTVKQADLALYRAKKKGRNNVSD